MENTAYRCGVLTGDEIRSLGIIEEDFDNYTWNPAHLKTTTYDLSVGDAHYVYDGWGAPEGGPSWKLVFIGDSDKLDVLNQREPHFIQPEGDLGKLTIPPYGSAIVQLEEIVNTMPQLDNNGMPILVVGRFDLKLSGVYKSLISQQATQVEPCYQGKLFCFIHNLSDQYVELNYRDSIATVEFSYISQKIGEKSLRKIIDHSMTDNARKYGADKSYSYKNGIKDVRWFAGSGRLPKTAGMAPFARKVSETIDNIPTDIDHQFAVWAEKADTIEKISERVESVFKRNQSFLTATITLVTILITLVLGGLNLYYYTEMKGLSIEFSHMQSQVSHILETAQDGKDSLFTVYSEDLYLQYCNRMQVLERKQVIVSITLFVALLVIIIFLCYRLRSWHANDKGGSRS